MLNHHVFAPLKFHSTWAEIWSVKNCWFATSSWIPEGNFGRWPKPIECKNPMAQQSSGGSGSKLCWECLELPEQAQCWLAMVRGAAALFPLPSSPRHQPSCGLFFFRCVNWRQIMESQLSGSWGGVNTHGLVLANGKGEQKTENVSYPWASGSQIYSPSAQ